MSLNSDHEERGTPPDAQQRAPIIIPNGSLIVLCGSARSGKGTFAHTFIKKHQEQDIKATAIVSSDMCRALPNDWLSGD